MRTILVTLVLGAPLLARPPEVPDFARIEELEAQLVNLKAKLERLEEFNRKLREEKLIILFQRGEESFEGKKLTGEYVVNELFNRWDEARKKEEEFTEQAKEILRKLADALRERYNVFPIPKRSRYMASRLLVKELTNKNFYLRKAAIDCLEAIYGRNLMYQADASPGRREAVKKKWSKEIEKLRK